MFIRPVSFLFFPLIYVMTSSQGRVLMWVQCSRQWCVRCWWNGLVGLGSEGRNLISLSNPSTFFFLDTHFCPLHGLDRSCLVLFCILTFELVGLCMHAQPPSVCCWPHMGGHEVRVLKGWDAGCGCDVGIRGRAAVFFSHGKRHTVSFQIWIESNN
jgi:hypothetical protein